MTFSSHLIRRAQNSLLKYWLTDLSLLKIVALMPKINTLLYSLHVSIWVSNHFLPSMIVFDCVVHDLIRRSCVWSDCVLLWIMWCSCDCETNTKTHGTVGQEYIVLYTVLYRITVIDHWDFTNKLCLVHIIICMNCQVNICFRKRSQ